MIVICEDCGKKYQIDPSIIKGREAKAKCQACGHMITVSKMETKPDEGISDPRSAPEPVVESGVSEVGAGHMPDQQEKQKKVTPKGADRRMKGMGLRSKIFLLFFFIPIILIITAGVLYLGQLNSLSMLISEKSGEIVKQLAEQIIRDEARSVAAQVKIYLDNHKDLKREQFHMVDDFRKIAVQTVGKTGYTALYAAPDEGGVWRTWAHANPKIVSIDMASLEKPMGRNFAGFWKIFSMPENGEESRGYYTWQEKDGSFREKYMVCSPVKDTPFVIAATTYLDEFTKPMTLLETRAREMTNNTRNIVFGILGGTLLLIAFIVAMYGQRLTGQIKSLTELAERISVGDMDAEIEINSKDELGDLAQAVSRMQDSIRLSIARLRRRRESRTV